MKNEKLKAVIGDKKDVSGLKLTRRELLETGLIGMAARLTVPSAFTSLLTLGQEAQAQTASMIPCVTLSLSGGAALHGNFVVKNSGGDLLSSYNKLGLGKAGFATEKLMGADFSATSRLHKGIQSVASTAALGKSRIVALCTDTAVDTNGLSALRPFYDLSGPLEKAGLVGKILPTVHFGSSAENLRPVFNSPNSILNISSLNDVFGSLNYTSVLGSETTLNKKQKTALSAFIGKMTKTQIATLNSKDGALKEVLQEAGIRSGDIIKAGGATGVDPRTDTKVQGVYGLAANAAVNLDTAVKAGVVFNALNGNVSHGRITLGGYDYHTPLMRSDSDTRDFNAGVEIGRMIELAHRMNKPIFIIVTTDGACSSEISDSSTSNWTGDYTTSLQLMITYDPSGKLSSSGNQIGHYNNDQSVDKTTLVGSRPDYVAAAILANYLNLNKRLDIFKQLAPATLQSDDVAKVVKLHVA